MGLREAPATVKSDYPLKHLELSCEGRRDFALRVRRDRIRRRREVRENEREEDRGKRGVGPSDDIVIARVESGPTARVRAGKRLAEARGPVRARDKICGVVRSSLRRATGRATSFTPIQPPSF